MARAVAAFVNDGNMVTPTLYKRTLEEAKQTYQPVISTETSEKIRYLMRLNALEGSGTRMNKFAAGYRTGGKTGTAEKVVKGRYDSSKTLAVFASAFPLDNPRYAMVILVDEPHNENEQSGHTAGWNAGEATGRIVQRVAPMLGISPDFNEMLDNELVPVELR
jgi:cell division protein FtsI (penicillin-binding protein 3)